MPGKPPKPLSYWCSRCHVDRGQKCVDDQGHPISLVHDVRMRLAQNMADLLNKKEISA
jgi:hypothetical protein